MLLERDRLTSGTTWHAAGLMVTFGSTSETSTEMRKYTRDLYARLEAETGQSTGLQAASASSRSPADADRLEEYRRVSAFNRYCGVDVHEISPREVKDLFPLAQDRRHPRRLLREGGRPRRSRSTSRWRSRRARACRARRSSRASPVTGVHHEARRRSPACATAYGDIEAEYVVNCAGMWARQLGAHVGRQHPAPGGRALLPHHREDPGLTADWPVLEDPASLRLLPRGGRRPDDRPVRADVRAVEGRRHPRRLLVRRDPARLGSHGPVRREGDGARADLDGDGRARSSSAAPRASRPDLAADRRRGARAEELLRRRRASTRSASSPAAASAA